MDQTLTVNGIIRRYLGGQASAADVRDLLMASPTLLWAHGSRESDRATDVLNLMFIVLDGAIDEREARDELQAMLRPPTMTVSIPSRQTAASHDVVRIMRRAVDWPDDQRRAIDQMLRPAATSIATRPVHLIRRGPFEP